MGSVSLLVRRLVERKSPFAHADGNILPGESVGVDESRHYSHPAGLAFLHYPVTHLPHRLSRALALALTNTPNTDHSDYLPNITDLHWLFSVWSLAWSSCSDPGHQRIPICSLTPACVSSAICPRTYTKTAATERKHIQTLDISSRFTTSRHHENPSFTMDSTHAFSVATSSSSATSSQYSPSDKIVPPAPIHTKTPSTDAFLKDFTLVAEAAKRAQIAVLMRDFENVGL